MQRSIKFGLLVLAFAVTPFCWSLIRDLAPLLFRNGDTANVEKAVAMQLSSEHQRIHLGKPEPLAQVEIPESCFSIAKDQIRSRFRLQNRKIDGIDEEFRSKPSIVSMNAHGISYAYLANGQAIEDLQKKLSPFELAALNGCMKASPFAKWCDEQVEKNMRVAPRAVEQDLVVRGLMRHALDDQGNEIHCTTIPSINEEAEHP
ncbi:hypothetical protein [Sphingopyxis sp.]|uniref:hypothetical protein n=1 Tax=Sphingopyxis sp. TaxID=1908224 RepID=UPI003D0C3E71